jgi:hypothetical protein
MGLTAIFVSAVLCSPLWAVPYAAQFSSSQYGTVNISGQPYASQGSFRAEGREIAWTMPSGASQREVLWAAKTGNIFINIQNAGGVPLLYLVDFIDGAPGINITLPLTGYSDFVWRITRNNAASLVTLELWNVNGSGYATANQTMTTPSTGLTGQMEIGDAAGHSAGTIGFIRWYSTILPIGSKAPFGSGTTASPLGDLGDWEFPTGGPSTIDYSGHGENLTWTGGTPTLVLAPTYGPACVVPRQITLRAGVPTNYLTAAGSFALDGTAAPTSYTWQQIPETAPFAGQVAPSALIWSSQTVVNPTISGIISGSYTIQLTVKQADGQTSTCSQKYGAVATDANGSVIVPNPQHAQILGPMIAAQSNPWPLYELWGVNYSNLIIQALAGTNSFGTQFVDYWNTPAAGTISIANGSTTVFGVGTHFLSQYCGGSAGPVVLPAGINQRFIVVWYPIGGTIGLQGRFGRRLIQVNSCESDAALTINTAWTGDTAAGFSLVPSSVSGVQYAYTDNGPGGASNMGGIGPWLSGNNPVDYYDNVVALYAEYYRTGTDDYLWAARTLADRFFSGPSIDQGVNYNGFWGQYTLPGPNRSISYKGLVLRALDNPPFDYWPGLNLIANYEINGNGQFPTPPDCRRVGPTISTCGNGGSGQNYLQDIREQSYATEIVALNALYSKTPSQQAASAAAVDRDMTNRWSAQAPAPWLMDDTGSGSWNNIGFSVSVSVGSSMVTAQAGHTFNAGNFTTPPWNSNNHQPHYDSVARFERKPDQLCSRFKLREHNMQRVGMGGFRLGWIWRSAVYGGRSEQHVLFRQSRAGDP